jgi:hypothetical protein
VLATDAVPESTALAMFYLGFRGASERAEVVPLDRIEARAREARPTLATNMHSFTEMPLEACRFWVRLAAEAGVRWLFVVPNADEHGGERLESWESDGTRLPMEPVLEAEGFVRRHAAPKYPDPNVQRYGISPTWYWLFERTA